MIRKVAAISFGAVIAIALIVVVQMIGHAVYPPPPGIDATNPETLKTLVGKMPVAALMLVILSYAVGAFGGGLLAALIARETPMVYALIVGALVLLGTLVNLVAIPHPTWFAIGAITAILATIFATGRLARLLITARNE